MGKRGDQFEYSGGVVIEVMTSPPFQCGPGDTVTARSASQAAFMADHDDFSPVTAPADKKKGA